MVDTNLQVRAGLNVGNEPAGGIGFVEKAGSKYTALPTNGTPVTIFEGIEGVIRTFNTQTDGAGKLINDSTTDIVDVTLLFVDEQGNEVPLLPGPVALTPQEVETLFGISGIFPCFAPGEKIVASAAVQAPPVIG